MTHSNAFFQEGKWADEICKDKHGFICKKDANSSPSTNDTVITNHGCKPVSALFRNYWRRKMYCFCYNNFTEYSFSQLRAGSDMGTTVTLQEQKLKHLKRLNRHV